MHRSLCAIALLNLSFALTGCKMCDDSYDYCGPVVNSGHQGGEYVTEGPVYSEEMEVVPSAEAPVSATRAPSRRPVR